MVIILVGALAVSISPKIDNDSIDVRRAAQDMVEAARYAQQLSMTHSGETHYRITIAANGFTVDQTDGTAVNHPQTGAASYTAAADEWSGSGIGNTLTGEIAFNSRGKPTCTTFDPCSNSDATTVSINVTKNSASSTVKIVRFTGFAYVE